MTYYCSYGLSHEEFTAAKAVPATSWMKAVCKLLYEEDRAFISSNGGHGSCCFLCCHVGQTAFCPATMFDPPYPKSEQPGNDNPPRARGVGSERAAFDTYFSTREEIPSR